MPEKLKREFIELLEKDAEFRYTVAGYLGLSEILKRLDGVEDGIRKLWEEVRALREGQDRLWKGQSELWEGQRKLWEEVHRLREGQNKLWEGQSKLWEEVRGLRQEQSKLWEEVRDLRQEQGKLRKYMVSGFRDLRRALGVAFEDHAASFLEVMLDEMGYHGAVVERKYFVEDGEVVEVNLFCEEPLVVGEATVEAETVEEAEKEVEKLLRRMKLAERIYGRKPVFAILSVARASGEAAGRLRELSEQYGVKLVLGKEMEEYLGA